MKKTKHAQTRQQQRCIPNGIVQWLLDYGDRQYDHNGCARLGFGKRSKQKLIQVYGPGVAKLIEDHRDAYVVVNLQDSTIITVGHRHASYRQNWAA